MPNFDTLNYHAVKLRNKFGINEFSPIDFNSILLSQEEITFLSFPMTDNLCGICVKDINNKVIAVNSSRSLGRQRFSLAHELYHLYIQEEFEFSVCTNDIRNPEEKKANEFARYFLIPQNTLYWFFEKYLKLDLNKIDINLSHIIKIEQYYQISHSAILYRLKDEGLINQIQFDDYKNDIIKTALSLGYDADLYRSTDKIVANGKYIKLVEKLLCDDKITNREYEEFLTDVGRLDLLAQNED